MKKLLISLLIISFGLIKAQEKSTSIREDIKIPFTCNALVDQYMADYQTFVKSAEYLALYGGDDNKQLINSEYMKFTQKYSDITKEIKTLDPGLQKFVAGFVQAKGVELTNLMRK
ncbi:hypothetical protein UJ101_02525 [Flavobacteriaceae bacterium UJ101]|nr:hypothetical protein UJ101_02525 [Flavobacteriaceae bacterium UJ101]